MIVADSMSVLSDTWASQTRLQAQMLQDGHFETFSPCFTFALASVASKSSVGRMKSELRALLSMEISFVPFAAQLAESICRSQQTVPLRAQSQWLVVSIAVLTQPPMGWSPTETFRDTSPLHRDILPCGAAKPSRSTIGRWMGEECPGQACAQGS